MNTQALQALACELPLTDHQQLMRLAANQVADARGLRAPWPVDLPQTTLDRLAKRINDLGDLAAWGAVELGTLHQELLSGAARESSGAWYTPARAAQFITLAAMSTFPGLTLNDDPGEALAVTVVDPACGGGVFLVAAARELARRHVALMYRTQTPAELTMQMVLPEVMRNCVFGMDLDPVGVDLAKTACWLACNGRPSIGWLDNNITTGDTLAGDLPPGLVPRLAVSDPLAIVGNPPFRDKAKGAAPWIEARRPGPRKPRTPDELLRPSLDEFRAPGNGRVEYALSNLHVYFWRWATWRAFETRLHTSTVAFLSTAAWLASPAFDGMRAYLRAAADDGWVINLTPEGKQPPVKTRLFPGVSQPLCIGIFTRHDGPQPDSPAHVRHAAVHGSQDEKYRALDGLTTFG